MFRIAPLALSLLFFSFPLRAEAQDAKPAPILLSKSCRTIVPSRAHLLS